MSFGILHECNVNHALTQLATLGATAFRVLDDEHLNVLHRAARRFVYERVPPYGPPPDNVRQDYSSYVPPVGSPFHELRDQLQDYLKTEFERWSPTLFGTPLCFDALEVNRYQASSEGVGLHREPLRFENLACTVVLSGSGRLWLFRDKEGRGAVELEVPPGFAWLLAAPGLLKLTGDDRRYHALTDVRDTRYVVCMRQLRAAQRA